METCPIDIDEHRRVMVAHFVRLFEVDPTYSRYAWKTYVELSHCPCPDIGKDIKQALEQRKNRSEDIPKEAA